VISAKYQHTVITALFVAVTITAWSGVCFGQSVSDPSASGSVYSQWKAVGQFAAGMSLEMIQKAAVAPDKDNLVVLTNAGYAEISGMSTQGALDGLAPVTGASRGKNTLVEIQASARDPLWFAVYDRQSGFCAYLEMKKSGPSDTGGFPRTLSPEMFGIRTVERIDAPYLYRHAKAFETRLAGRIFGDNAFRVITIANAVASGAGYVQTHFPPGSNGYFVHGVDPWCKEDALIVLLNATPGKKKYAVSYPVKADQADRLPEVENAATIVYRRDDQTLQWEGMILGFDWADTSCPETGNGIIDKLCIDLWYLDQIDSPEAFVKVLKTVALPDGVSPLDWAGPGTDPLKMMGLTRK